jgi:ketosteroid isomerase-like protein
MNGMTPKETMHSYFEAWKAGDFDRFETLLGEEVTFAGPLGTASGPRECREGLEGMRSGGMRPEVVTIVADGPDVITWFELHSDGAPAVEVANYAEVRDGKVRRVRAAFDPRPLLAR